MIVLAARLRAPIVTAMPTTAPTPSTETTSSARGRRRAVHRTTTASLAAMAVIAAAVQGAHGTAASTPARPSGGCTLTPTANSVAFNVTALLMTVRITDGVIEILHDAHCTDGRSGTVWITANII